MIFKEDNRINLLAERDKRIKEQEQALQILNQERLKNILFRDIRKYNSKKPKKSEQAYKFAKRLKGMEINQLRELLSEKQQKKKLYKLISKLWEPAMLLLMIRVWKRKICK